MAAFVIPCTPGLLDYSMSIKLSGSTYRLRFRWNSRQERWLMDIGDDAGLILSSLVLNVGIALFRRYQSTRLPPGDLIVVDTTGANLEAGINDLGVRVQPIYSEG